MMGLEPTTLGTTNRCSNQLSYIYRLESAKVEISALFANSFFKKNITFCEPEGKFL